MATEVKVPPMGESITSGFISEWYIADGAYVESGQPLYSLETDKATSEIAAETSGVVSHKAEEGEEVEIGQIVASIDASGPVPESAEKEEAQVEPGKQRTGGEMRAGDGDEDGGEGQAEEEVADPALEKTGKSDGSQGSRSPAVRRLAAETGIDPGSLSGTGKGGRVTKGDMLEAAKEGAGKGPSPQLEKAGGPSPAPVSGGDQGERHTRKKLSPMRRKIGERLVHAQRTAAILTTFNECDMSGVMALRKKYQDDFVKKNGIKLGFMSFFVKAVVQALKEVPALNSYIDGGELVQNNFYDIGVAVSTDKGLLVPVIRDCDKLSFVQIEQQIAAFAKKARDNKISMDDLRGGSYTITNGGIFGSMLSTPILNPPQSGILGMHNIVERPVAVDGEVKIRPVMYLAHSYDHRVVDGREAVTFLVKVKQAIEDPTRLLIEI